MHEGVMEGVIHVLLVVAYTALAGILTMLGVAIEYKGYLIALAGDAVLAIWVAGLGLVVLAFAFFVVRDKLLVEYATLRS